MSIRCAPNQMGTMHPGADDNASGTAGVIELARWFSKQPQPQRGILFMTFAGEELGLLGSNWYVNHPELPLENAVAMLNLDMIGRVQDGHIFVNGAQTGSTFARILDEVKLPPPLWVDESGKNSGTGYERRQRSCVLRIEADSRRCFSSPACTPTITSPAIRRIRSTPPTPRNCSITWPT